jgi:hypothetical protein
VKIVGTEISEDNFKAFFEAFGMGSYTALDNIFTSEDDDPRGTERKNALVISLTELPTNRASNSIWENNEMYTFELFHPQKQAVKRIRKGLQEYPDKQYYSNPCDDINDFVIYSGSPVISGGRLLVTNNEAAGFDASTKINENDADDLRLFFKMETDNVTPTGGFYRMEGAGFTIIGTIFFDAGKLKAEGSTTVELMSVTNNTEYLVEVRFNFTAQTYDVYVDNIARVINHPFFASVSALTRNFISNAAVTNAYFDDIILATAPYINLDRYEKVKFDSIQYLNKRFNGMHKWRIIITTDKLEENI